MSSQSRIPSFQDIISNFTKETGDGFLIPSKIEKESKSIRSHLDRTRLLDNKIQITLRIISSIFFGGLLAYQNIVVFQLVTNSVNNKILAELQVIFSVLIGATLFETYKIAEIMVKWLFKDIDYK